MALAGIKDLRFEQTQPVGIAGSGSPLSRPPPVKRTGLTVISADIVLQRQYHWEHDGPNNLSTLQRPAPYILVNHSIKRLALRCDEHRGDGTCSAIQSPAKSQSLRGPQKVTQGTQITER